MVINCNKWFVKNRYTAGKMVRVPVIKLAKKFGKITYDSGNLCIAK